MHVQAPKYMFDPQICVFVLDYPCRRLIVHVWTPLGMLGSHSCLIVPEDACWDPNIGRGGTREFFLKFFFVESYEICWTYRKKWKLNTGKKILKKISPQHGRFSVLVDFRVLLAIFVSVFVVFYLCRTSITVCLFVSYTIECKAKCKN